MNLLLLACLTVQNAAHEKVMHTGQLLACHLQCLITCEMCAVSYVGKTGVTDINLPTFSEI